MKAEEFNKLIADKISADHDLAVFKTFKNNFYLDASPNIVVLFKKTMRQSFEGYYLALTHNFFSNTRDPKGRLKLPGYIEQYPVSISMDELENQFRRAL